MRIAKLEIKAIISFFVMTFDHDIVVSNRRLTSGTPLPDYNKALEVGRLMKQVCQ
jgi:hypothetical protein